MTITDLEKQISDGKSEFIGETIQISGNGTFITGNSLLFIQNLTFDDCIFIGTHLEFEDVTVSDFYLGFFNCTFHVSIAIKDCSFNRLGFRDNKSSKYIDINGGHYKNFFFRNNDIQEKKENILSGNISICNLIIDERIELDYLNHTNGEFDFSNNTLGTNDFESKNKIITFENSTFDTVKFDETNFIIQTTFERMEIKTNCAFHDCQFNKVDFTSIIIRKINFINSKFYKTSLFHYVRGNTSGRINFENCSFEQVVQFNGTKSSRFRLDDVEFKKIVSLQDTSFDIIFIDRTVFEKGALFDDIKIKNIGDCQKRTIRTIKQELQKSENRIDYNRFRSYELAAHYNELNWNWNSGFIDKSILFLSKISTDFGNSWRKGLRFIIVVGFLFYLLLYIFENRNYILDLSNYENWERLISGFFRFLLITDFYNPLETDRIYLTNPFSWLIFILGKIFIAFGIYEMIQSFRKFKA
ncbi:pentapeptide repeat-containing protein [Flavobacterium sp. ASV13]|uniref:pentapeptide repeat-containing protein n=1 Tax=Flavobacterium sp. ASV13 TaxID=1506583 RepID=UPI00055071DA|nr:pentapeptide repeat-containing protein [Flavobacterium sp. ASV13]